MNKDAGFKTYICAGALIWVADELSAADRLDSLDALLYCQTVAAHKTAQFSDKQAWAHANKMAIKVTGAMLVDNPNVSFPVSMPATFTLPELVQRIMRPVMPLTMVDSQDSGWQVPADQATAVLASELLQTHVVYQERWIRFMFSIVSPGVTITTAMISFEYDENIVSAVLEQRFSTEKIVGDLFVDAYKAFTETEDYDFSRATIISLLGARRQEQVIALA